MLNMEQKSRYLDIEEATAAPEVDLIEAEVSSLLSEISDAELRFKLDYL